MFVHTPNGQTLFPPPKQEVFFSGGEREKVWLRKEERGEKMIGAELAKYEKGG